MTDKSVRRFLIDLKKKKVDKSLECLFNLLQIEDVINNGCLHFGLQIPCFNSLVQLGSQVVVIPTFDLDLDQTIPNKKS